MKHIIIGAAFMLCFGCSQDTQSSNDTNDPPPPPVEECKGFMEVELNDDHATANYVSLLPNDGTICGNFLDFDPFTSDKDFYHFFLNPHPGDDEILFNFVVMTTSDVVPAVQLYQTVYDDLGVPEDYIQIGTFFGHLGELIVIDFPVKYDFHLSNDLYVRIDGIYPSNDPEVKPYEVEFWTE